MNKILIICGPTATGKTSLGIRLAKKFHGELISADSRQVYKGMDIITGKDLPVNSKFKIQNSKLQPKSKKLRIGFYSFEQIPVWLLDIVQPNFQFNVAEYVKCADLVIKDIWERNKLPIIVGGTGFYIKAIIEGIETMGIKPDWELRGKLSNYPISELRIKLGKLDPKRLEVMNESDQKNPRRLIRAIEIARKLKTPAFAKASAGKQNLKLDTFFIGLKAPYKILYRRIDSRIDEQLEQGAEEEIRNLLKKSYQWDNSAMGTTIGYREWRPFFERKATREEVIQRWKFAEHAYARRQMTWFRKALSERSESKGKWFDITDKKWQDKIESLIKEWYGRN